MASPKRQIVVVAQYACAAEANDELSFKAGDRIVVTKQVNWPSIGWWEGSLNGRIGLFPSNYVRLATAAESEDVGGLIELNGIAQRRRQPISCAESCNMNPCSIQ